MTINYYTTSTFANPKIAYGFFTRKDGFSFNNFYSLNCSYSSGDQGITVKKNIEQAQKKLKFKLKYSFLDLVKEMIEQDLLIARKEKLIKDI